MQSNLSEMNIHIPDTLGERIEESLDEVRSIHRRKTLRRAGTLFGSFAVAVGAFLVFGFTNPALAAQIPLLGRLFQQVNTGGKVYGPANLESYGVVSAVNTKADSTNENCGLYLVSAYSDGNTAQLSFRLEFLGELSDRYHWIDTQYGETSSVTVNGVAAEDMQMNSFSQVEGEWVSTMNFTVPEEVKGAEVLELQLALSGFSGTLEEYDSKTGNAPPAEKIDSAFTLTFPLKVDHAHSFGFTCNAEENGARVTAVSGTPSQTVISIEKPYWGEIFPGADPSEPDAYPKGFPHLYTESGEEIQQNWNAANGQGGYDSKARETQRADLYFDGVPAGTEKLTFRFVVGDVFKDVLAEFSIDLTEQTVTPSGKIK